MKLPNGSSAVVDVEKLRDYCLSAQHPEGRHKARVFLSALGMTSADADRLREILLSAATVNNEVSMSDTDHMVAATHWILRWCGVVVRH